MKRNYELLFLFSQRTDLYIKSLEFVKKLLAELQLAIIQEEDLGIKALAYPIKKHTNGHYYVFYVEMEGGDVVKLAREVLLNEAILRHLILEIDANAKKFLFNKEYRHYHHRKAAEYHRQREVESKLGEEGHPSASTPLQTEAAPARDEKAASVVTDIAAGDRAEQV